MKILYYLFTTLFILGLTSCSSSDDDNPQDGTILGKWNVKEMRMSGNFTDEGMTVDFTAVSTGMAGNDITFKDNNTFTGHSAPFEIEMTFIMMGQSHTVTQPAGEALPVSGEWSREGNTLFLQETGNERTKYTIETLNNTTLKLTADQNSIDMGDDLPPGAQFNVTITLER